MWHKREAERPFSEKIEEERWKNGAVLNHHPFVKAGGGCCSTFFPLTKHGAICFEESHGRRWRRFGTLAEISKK
ncbi:hypothetical protein B4109_2733 [Geobacillus stearothermophilus]|uniref:Uncharacterized protein n=1 Tax=Geobacillus stearothermophilus TaxID=1422 RepID=A0A150MIT5_GEOSE|nr:hypothetical protein B4109_2733 [Geobacillus stearothermophilus]